MPIGAKVCPACGEIPTFRDLVEATVGPPRRRVRNYCDNAPPHAKRLAQWIYLLLSATLLWWLLGYVQQVTGGHWLGLAALWYFKSAGPNKRPSVDGLPVHVNGNGPAFSPDGCSLEKIAYC